MVCVVNTFKNLVAKGKNIFDICTCRPVEFGSGLKYHSAQFRRQNGFMSDIHQFPVRVYYEDTDAGGIVYYANYLKFFERARTEWLRALGIEQDLLLTQDIAFVVRKVLMENKAPARFNQLLMVKSQIRTLKNASIVFWQKIYNENAQLLCSAEVSVACVQLSLMKARGIPRDILGVLSSGDGRTFCN